MGHTQRTSCRRFCRSAVGAARTRFFAPGNRQATVSAWLVFWALLVLQPLAWTPPPTPLTMAPLALPSESRTPVARGCSAAVWPRCAESVESGLGLDPVSALVLVGLLRAGLGKQREGGLS